VLFALLVFLCGVTHAAPAAFDDSFRAGLLALQSNQLQAAESNLQTAAKLDPGNGRVWIALSQTYWKLREPRKAEEAAAKALALSVGDPVVLRSLVIYYSESGQPVKAAGAQADYANANPAAAEARGRAVQLYFEAAQDFLRREKFADALRILQAAKTKLGSDPQIELGLGVAYYGLRRFDQAAAAFLQTIALSPRVEQPYLFLGKMLDQIPDRLPEVTRRFAEYQAANPSSYSACLLHAKVLDAQSIEPEAARKLLNKAIALNGGDPAAHFEMGVLLDRMRLFDEAAREFECAAALDSSDAATHYRLARVYERLGKREAAAAEREQHARLVKAQDAAR
jgi:tetratricopeptide (TPR) repeat protein